MGWTNEMEKFDYFRQELEWFFLFHKTFTLYIGNKTFSCGKWKIFCITCSIAKVYRISRKALINVTLTLEKTQIAYRERALCARLNCLELSKYFLITSIIIMTCYYGEKETANMNKWNKKVVWELASFRLIHYISI